MINFDSMSCAYVCLALLPAGLHRTVIIPHNLKILTKVYTKLLSNSTGMQRQQMMSTPNALSQR